MASRKGQRHILGVSANLSELTLNEEERWAFPAVAGVICSRDIFLAFHFSICYFLPLFGEAENQIWILDSPENLKSLFDRYTSGFAFLFVVDSFEQLGILLNH